MFEVGIKSAQEQLEKIKQEFTKANGELQKLLTLKVSIEGVDTITKALGQIGDSDALRKLRNEVAALNREFSILSKGAGGSGDIAGRGLAADIERTSQSIDRYTSKIKQLTEERSRLIGGTRNSSYQNFTDEILRYEQSLEGARKKLAQLNEQKNQSVASEPLKKSTQDAQAFETALGRIETAIGSLKSGMSVNLTGDFSKWAQEVKKGSESTLADNLQRLKSAITDVRSEYNRLNEAYGSAKDMGMPTNNAIEERLYNLRRLITMMEQLAQAAQTAGSDEAEALSRSKAFSFFKFNNNQLFSKETNKLYSKKEIDGYIKSIDEFVKAEGRMAQTSGAATNTIADIGSALGRAAERASQAGNSFSQTAAGIQNFAMNIETARLAYDKTLRGIADLESRISAGQKANMDKESLDFMNSLKQRAQQWADVLKKILGEDMKGNPAYREFLSMSSNILTRPQTGNGLQALLGADWKILLKDIGETFNMLMKFSGFNKSLTLDNATLSNWLKGEEAVRRLENALKDLNRQWGATNNNAKTPDLTAKYEDQKRAIESLIAQIKGAMTEEARMSNRNGLADILGVGFKNAVGYDNTRLIQEMKSASNEVDKAEKERTKRFEQYMKEREKARQQEQKAATKAAQDAEKDNKKWADSMDYAKTKANELRLTIEKMERIKTVGNNLGLDTSSLSAQIDRLKQNLSTLYGMMGGSKIGGAAQEFVKSSAFKIPLADANTASNILKSSDAYKEASANIKKAESEARKLQVTISNLEAFAHKAEVMGIDTAKLRAQINDLKIYKQSLDNIASGRDRQSVKKFVTADWFLETKREIKDATSSIKKEMSNALKPDNEGVNALKEYVSLLKQITSLTKTANRGEALGFDVQTMRNQIALLEQYAKRIEQFAVNKGVGFNAWMQATPVYGEARMNIAADQAKMNTAIANAKQTNSHATTQLSESEQNLANAIKGSTDSMRGQSQVLSDLKMMAMQYLSVWGAQSFINSIIETGGQLEQQRLSLSAILGDMEKASTLFGQIKELALKSPFGVVELDKMSKQLAAYSFEYEELFDWTRRLADISAATGTSVDRLALALGHVRSEGALSGYTLRQFAMANVPVLRMLSENMGISSKEVRERVKKKEISAEDVQDILKQLTDDGGMFANAQETMSEALNAKFKNLRDAFDIMYGEIAEGGVGDKLKELAVILTQGAKHWERLGKDVLMVAAALGMGKVAMLLYNKAVGEGTAATLKSAFAAKEREVANLKLAKSYRTLTIEEEAELAMQRKWWSFGSKLNSRNIMVLLSTKKLTVAQLERAVAMGKVSKADAIAAMNLLKLNTAQMQSVKVFGFWGRIGATIANGFRMASLAVKSFAASVAPLLALTAVFELWNRRNEQKDAARNMAGSMAGVAPGREAFDLRGTLGDPKKLSEEALQSNIESMKEALIAANAYTDSLKKQVDEIESSVGKYDLLKKKLDEVADKYEETKNAQESALKDALDTGGGYFTDNMLEDAKDYDSAFSEYTKALTVGSKQIKEAIKNWMEANGLFKQEYASMTGKQMLEQLSSQDQSRFLGGGDRNIYRSRGYDESTRDALENIANARKKVSSAFAEMKEGQGEEFASIMKSVYEEAFKVDLDKATDEQKIAFDKWLRETIGRAEGLSKDAKEALRNIVIDFTITLVPHYQIEKPQTAQDVIDQQIGDNKWLSGFFGRQNTGTQVWTVETAQKEVKKYKKLLGDISLSNLDTAPKKLNSLLDGLEETKKNLQNTLSDGLLSTDEKKDIEKSLKETTDSIDIANKALKDVGGKRKRKGDKSGNKNYDTERAKAVREQVRVIKEAADAFQYWREKVGDKGAWEHVQREFGDVLKKIGITAQNIEDVRSHLNRIPESKEYKAIKDKKVKTEIDKEIAKENDQFFRKDFEKNAKEFTSSMQMQIDDLTQKWEIFKSVVSATGDELLAQRLSGVTPGATPADLKRLNVSSAAGVDIDFDKVLGMSDKEIDEYVTTLGIAEDRIDEIRLGLKDWKKAQKDVSKSDIESYARWLGSLVDIQSVRNRNEMEYQDIVRETNRLLAEGRITQEEAERRIRSAAITRDSKNSQATATYSMLYNNSLGMAQEELVNILAEEIESLNKQFEAGDLSAADYADKISKINQIQREFDMQGFLGIKGGVGAFLGGGSEGLANYYRNRAEAARKRASGYRKGESPEEQDAADKAEQEAKHYESMYTSLIKVTDSAKKVATAFDTLKNGVGLLEDLFANMGNGSAAQAMGDAGDILGGMMSGASSLSALGPYGMAAGAGLGLVSGLFALHDKSIQREIDAIKDQIDATKENTEAIKRARERTLGYDMGVLRDRMSDMYQDTTRKRFSLFGGWIDETDEAKLAMKEYYSLNSRRSGYSAELENLKKEREYYMQIYNLESSKKNVSEEALREYKKQIAELDDQILYFVEDLANDLWGIDFKAWSEQISDALWTAFENGEDAVQAFHDTADDIIADVAKKMMNIHLIEPVFKKLEDRLFGELNSNGQRVGGVYNEQTGQFDETKTLEILGQFFGENGEFARVINSAEDFYDMTKRVTGFDFSGDSSGSMSAGIKGITEQTADLLASYVNAIRADVSVNRQMIAQYFPMYYAAMTSGNRSLANIENHTAAIMRSNDIVAEKITSLDNNIIGLKNKTWKVPMA